MPSVWIITRPLSMANFLPPLAWTSDGIDYLRHWGVFITDNTFLDIEVILQRTRAWGNNEIDLGTLYELRRDLTVNNVNVIRPFTLAVIRQQWRAFSTQYIGKTEMSHGEIELECKQPNEESLTYGRSKNHKGISQLPAVS